MASRVGKMDVGDQTDSGSPSRGEASDGDLPYKAESGSGESAVQPRPLQIGTSGATDSGLPTTVDDKRTEGIGRGKARGDKSGKTSKIRQIDGATRTPAETELWQKLEKTMSAKQMQVLRVLEDFGIADVEPASDDLEEQIWRVVQGETTFQEAVDLV